MSRKWINLSFLLVSYTVTVFVLATFVHEFNRASEGPPPSLANSIVFALPLVIVAFVAWNVVFPASTTRETRKCAAIGVAQLGSFLPLCLFVAYATLMASDEYFSSRYLQKVRKELSSDERFKDVRLLGLSSSYLLYPYHPVSGTVETEEDRITLNRVLRRYWTPGSVSAFGVRVKEEEDHIESFGERLQKKEKARMEGLDDAQSYLGPDSRDSKD